MADPRPPPDEPIGPGVDFSTLPPIPKGSSFGAEWWIAWSHLRSKKSEAFLSIVTVMSIVGVTAGVAVINWVIAVMTGFEVDLRDKILGANAHVVVFRYGGNMVDYDDVTDDISEVDGVLGASPFVYTEMMIRSPWASTGVILKGVDHERTGAVTHVLGDLTEGYLAEPAEDGPFVGVFETPEARLALFDMLDKDFEAIGIDGHPYTSDLEPGLPPILIGKELREQLQVRPGDKVQLINPMGGGTGPLGMPTPSVRSVRVAGVFHSGMYEYDTKWTYVPNDLAQDFLKIGPTVTGIEVKVEDIDDVDNICKEIEARLGGYPYYTRHWKNLNAKLFEALQLEKWVMGLLLQMITVVAGLLIITTLFMLVLTKGREIAILKAMGATSSAVLRIFVIEGSVIGVLGTGAGTILGLIGCVFLDGYEYPLETDVYYLNTLPVVVDPAAVATIAVSAFAICFLCTLYPAWRAAALDPVEALRYE